MRFLSIFTGLIVAMALSTMPDDINPAPVTGRVKPTPIAVEAKNVEVVGHWDSPMPTRGVAVGGDYLFLTDDSGLRVFDIGNRAAPMQVGFFDLPQGASSVAIDGEYAYVPDNTGVLRVIDISNPTAPVETGVFDPPTGGAFMHTTVVIPGGYAYVTDSIAGLWVVDISNPAAPVSVGSFAWGGATSVAVSGEYAYLAVSEDAYPETIIKSGLQVLDIANPVAPVKVGEYEVTYAKDVAVSGDYLYLADCSPDGGLRVLYVGDPATPVEVGFWPLPFVSEVEVSGRYLFAISFNYMVGFYDLWVMDTSDPTALMEVGHYLNSLGIVEDMVVSGEDIFVADNYQGLFILRFSDEVATTDKATSTRFTQTPTPTNTDLPYIPTFTRTGIPLRPTPQGRRYTSVSPSLTMAGGWLLFCGLGGVIAFILIRRSRRKVEDRQKGPDSHPGPG